MGKAIIGEREPKPAMLLRLLEEAQAGVHCECTLAYSLEFLRDQYGLSRGEFAVLLGLQRSRYREIVNGKRGMPLNAIKRAYAVGVPADVLLSNNCIVGAIWNAD